MHTNNVQIPKQNSHFLARTYRQALIPGILSLLSGNLTLMVDGLIVGQCLGSSGLSAVNLCMPIYLTICIFGAWIVSGTAIHAVKEMGAGHTSQGNWYCHIAQAFCGIAAVILTVLGLVLLKPIVRLLCSDEALVPMVYEYAWTAVISAPSKLLIYIPFWYLRLEGKNRSITIMMAILGFGNVALDLWFMLGLDLGIWGAGMASFAAYVAAVTYGMYCLFCKGKNFTVGIALPKNRKQLQDIISTGSPSATHNLFQALRVLTINSLMMLHGGTLAVATFTAVTGVGYFSECILAGVPQAASAMLGSFVGDGDTGSIRLIIRHQLKVGLIMDAVFGLLVVAGSSLISAAYGLYVPFFVPMVCLALSIFPGLICTVITGYYNTIGMNRWANLIVFNRVFFFPALFLLLCIKTSLPVWLFMPAGELITMLLWLVIFGFLYRKDSQRSRLLRLPQVNPDGVISSSMEGAAEQICSLSEGMLEFCNNRGMDSKTAMKLSLTIEELLVLISEENASKNLFCDLRIRIGVNSAVMTLRYSGIDYNPLSFDRDEDERFLGIQMLEKMAKSLEYQNISGMNVLRIQL